MTHKRMIVLMAAAGLICASAAMAAADAESEPIIVPVQDGSRPPMLRVRLMQGGLRVRGTDRKDISVETHQRSEAENHPRSDGMRRLDLNAASGIDIKAENNVVDIKTDAFNKGGDLVILVPRKSSLQLKCMTGGDIDVENVDGEIEAENLNGAIHLNSVAGSVVAHSLNGEVSAELTIVDPTKPMSFSTMNGNIDVTLPANVKARVSLKTDNGEILSDFDVKLDASTRALPPDGGRQADGTFHVRLDKTLHGSINGGGPEYQFRSFNGQIVIRKKK